MELLVWFWIVSVHLFLTRNLVFTTGSHGSLLTSDNNSNINKKVNNIIIVKAFL